MANIGKMADAGHLVAAGPFVEEGVADGVLPEPKPKQ